MRISDCSSDVCSSDLAGRPLLGNLAHPQAGVAAEHVLVHLGADQPVVEVERLLADVEQDHVRQYLPDLGRIEVAFCRHRPVAPLLLPVFIAHRSEEHTSELQSLMRISYAVFCWKKKKKHTDSKL